MNRRELLKLMMAAAVSGCAPKTSAPPKNADVIVVGAGVAGLNCALTLQDAGISTLVLEGNNRVGGRIYTHRGESATVEVGGQEVGAMYSHTLSALDRFGIERRKAELGIDGYCYLIGDQVYSKAEFQQAFADRLSAAELPLAPTRVRDAYFPQSLDLASLDWSRPELAQYDITVQDNMQAGGATQTALRFAGHVNATPIDDQSILWDARRKAFSKQNSQGDFYQLPAGMDALPRAMAGALNNPVMQNKPVHAIQESQDGVTLHCADGSRYHARCAVVAVPLPVLRNINIEPTLSSLRVEALNDISYGAGTSLFFKIKRRYWEEDGLPAAIWTDGNLGRAFRWRSAFGDYIWAFVTGPAETAIRAMNDTQAYRFIMDGYAAARPSMAGALEPIYRFSWTDNPFSKGTFQYWGVGDSRYASAFRGLEGRIAFAGSHTVPFEMGIEAAMASGVEAAFEILAAV